MWALKRTTQCAKCPWRVDVDPHDIPNGYSVDRHRALARTIAAPMDVGSLRQPQHVMACHETQDTHCIGWLVNQLGPGNNLQMRMEMFGCINGDKIRLLGGQHERFEDTARGSLT